MANFDGNHLEKIIETTIEYLQRKNEDLLNIYFPSLSPLTFYSLVHRNSLIHAFDRNCNVVATDQQKKKKKRNFNVSLTWIRIEIRELHC